MRDFTTSFIVSTISGCLGSLAVLYGRSTYRRIKSWFLTRKLVKSIRKLIGDNDLHA